MGASRILRMIEVRDASPDELPVVFSIMLQAFEEYRGVLEPPSGALVETVETARAAFAEGGAVLALIGGEPVGSARYTRMPDHLYCSRLATLPAHRGKGVAGAMLGKVHEIAQALGYAEVRLSTREVMEANLRFYLRLGYEIIGKEPHPKGEGIVVLFRKRLTP